MAPFKKTNADLLEHLEQAGGLRVNASKAVAQNLEVPEAHVYGAGSFYHLLQDPEVSLRVCTGLSCSLRGSDKLLAKAKEQGINARECSCLAACDRACAALYERTVLVDVQPEHLEGQLPGSATTLSAEWRGTVGSAHAAKEQCAMHLGDETDFRGEAYAKAVRLGADQVLKVLAESGLQGRGGAGFPTATKWQAVRSEPVQPHYIVLNADEGEPGTFKDRDLLLRRPDRVLEGLAIAASCLGAKDVYLYLRGAFVGPSQSVKRAIEEFENVGLFPGVQFHLHFGHGAYICGEETALLEALEGKRGMPRLKPPYPTQKGLWGKPTLIQNVETMACVPSIVVHGGKWFRNLGKTEPGTKLYSISGDVTHPGTYELPLGSTLDELVDAAGGYQGELMAFSPGGASSGFLPASERNRPLDFRSLSQVGSMLGSAGVVVLNTQTDLRQAARNQLVFFENESCGQCAPCRIGTRFLREALDADNLDQLDDVAWEMKEGSICGLGQVAALPLTSIKTHFPRALRKNEKG